MIPEKLKYSYQKDLITQHLIDLSPEDKYLRFGYAVPDENIIEYVDRTWFDMGNMWFGIFDEDKLIATLHCAMIERDGAEMGCTVDEKYRGNGCGQQLFDRGLTWCRSSGAKFIYMHCLTQNKIIQHIAKKNNMDIVPQGIDEREAHLRFDHIDFNAPVQDLICDRIAAVDGFWRGQRKLLNSFFSPLNNYHGKTKSKTNKKSPVLHSRKKG